MILAFDTYYYDNKAKTVCVQFDGWEAATPQAVFTEIKTGIADYEPGAFYKRELPCIVSLLQQIPPGEIAAVIIDGFVVLNDEGLKGLGGYVYELLEGKVPVIGVAKSNFASLVHHKRELLRGDSSRPLFITAMGMDVDVATECIRKMYGNYRIPELLKKLDTITREREEVS